MVQIGHDGSAEAAQWLEVFQARRLRTPNVDLLSPVGVPSEAPPGLACQAAEAKVGRVFALLPDGRVLCGLESQAIAMEKPCIGTAHEWEHWDYAMVLLGSGWRDFYSWEYWRFLQPPTPMRKSSVAESLHALAVAAAGGVAGTWWRSGSGSEAAAAMLAAHGFCILDDFLPAAQAEALAGSAVSAWQGGSMAAGVLRSGAGFARGDSVLWVNTEDPACRGIADGLVPEVGQLSAAVPELGSTLAHIDALVSETLAPRLSQAACIGTRSHAMFTCYPASVPHDDRESGYLRHVDNDKAFDGGYDNGRVLTTILYLNTGWEDSHAGQLRLFENFPPLQVRSEVLPMFNRLVAFWASEVPHEVLAPIGRDRFACTFWYLDREPGPSAVAFQGAPAQQLPPPAALAGLELLD